MISIVPVLDILAFLFEILVYTNLHNYQVSWAYLNVYSDILIFTCMFVLHELLICISIDT